MGIKCGIVGLPNVGKSTLFNALTKAQIAAENYPFCTIDPNVGVVPVPDPRLAADSLFLADGPLSQLRLVDDRLPMYGKFLVWSGSLGTYMSATAQSLSQASSEQAAGVEETMSFELSFADGFQALGRATTKQDQGDHVHDESAQGDTEHDAGRDRLGTPKPCHPFPQDCARDEEEDGAVQEGGEDLPAQVAVRLLR